MSTGTPNVAAPETRMSRACPVCQGSEREPLERWSQAPWEVVRCRSCRMVYLRNPPVPELLKSEFDWDIHKDGERARRRKAKGAVYYFFSDLIKKVRAFFRSFAPRKEIRYTVKFAAGKRILDVGCGGGHILANLPAEFIPYGVEPSPGMHAQADASFRPRGGFCIHNVAHTGLAELPEGITFDLILMRSFLEHDSMASETLSACLKSLSPHGKVLIKVPNFGSWSCRLRGGDWPGIRHPDHVNYFTPETLTHFLLKTGFSKVHMPLIWRLPTSDNLWALAHR